MNLSHANASNAARWTNPWILVLCGVVLFFLLDALLFRTGLYRRYLRPESTAGQLYRMCSLQKEKEVDNAVAVCGDSRMAEGFSARLANETGKPGEVQFVNLAIPGTTPRVWYYLLREIDPKASRFSAIAIMLPDYNELRAENLNERLLDLNYLAPILRYTDAFSLPDTFENPDTRMHALACCLLRGSAFKADLLDLLADPAKRLKSAAIYRKHWRSSNYNYTGRPESLEGLAADPSIPGGLRFAENVKPDLQKNLADYFSEMKNPSPAMSQAPYRALWLGKIADRYRNSRTRLIIFQAPRGPLHYFEPAKPATGVLAEMQKNNRFMIIPPERFTRLERPEFFFDYLHMNARGRESFSKEFAALIRSILQAPAQTAR